jgi:choline dehydrogenase-like flavoprotein
MPDWTPARRTTARSFCDTIFGSVAAESDEHGFWRCKASDFGVDLAFANALGTAVPEPFRSALIGLIDALGGMGFNDKALEQREAMVRAVAASSPYASAGVTLLTQIVLGLAYGLPDAHGRNPTWPALGYPGPLRAPAAVDKPLRPLVIDRDQTLDADVCVIGSGAGGGVIAGELARRGRSVLVIEAGGYFNEADFNQLEMWAYQNLYWRGGYIPTADGNVSLIAAATLGGGTQVNWENCVRTPAWVRRDWAQRGLDGLDGPAFDRAIDGVLERIGANDHCSELNGPHLRLEAGARALGYRFRRIHRNVDPRRHDPETAGYHGFGDVSGARQSTVNTYLADAQTRGTRIVVRARAERIIVEAGRATGVEVTATGPDGAAHRLRVRAPQVVAACGALETPALLLRSALGGPAAGDYLHLHPVVFASGVYAEPQRAWWGPPQAGLIDEFLQLDDDHGFLLECPHHAMMVTAPALPWRSARDHKSTMALGPRTATFIAIPRDRGHGRVTIDASGGAVPSYAVREPRDIALLHRAMHEMLRLHEAAGAEQQLVSIGSELLRWYRGDDLDAFARRIQAAPLAAGGQPMFSAHQMGSARMGRDPSDSVAQPTGELHDVHGVWIGDTSAFPTAVGVNPMITCMALAVRTAEHIAAARYTGTL